jgi:hypothetical protein
MRSNRLCLGSLWLLGSVVPMQNSNFRTMDLRSVALPPPGRPGRSPPYGPSDTRASQPVGRAPPTASRAAGDEPTPHFLRPRRQADSPETKENAVNASATPPVAMAGTSKPFTANTGVTNQQANSRTSSQVTLRGAELGTR